MLKKYSDKNIVVVDEPSLWKISNGSIQALYAGGSTSISFDKEFTIQVGDVRSYNSTNIDPITPYIPTTDPNSNSGYEYDPTIEVKNQPVTFNVNIHNNTGSTVQLDGQLKFVVGNPDSNGNYLGWNGEYNYTDRITFSEQAITLEAGSSRYFQNITWIDSDSGGGLGGKSPANTEQIVASGYPTNVVVYKDNNSSKITCQNLPTSFVFSQGCVCEIYLLSINESTGDNTGGDDNGEGGNSGGNNSGSGSSTTGNPVVSINVNITNSTNTPVSLDGRLRFMLGNPNQDGSWFAGWSGGSYIRTDNIWFSSSSLTLGAGKTISFSNLSWTDEDTQCGLGNASPLDSSYLPIYADDGGIAYAGNILMYTGGRSDITLCQNLSSSIVFQEGGTYDLVITSHS